MDMGMRIDFEKPIGMSVGMGMIFENGYECGYSSTCPTPIPINGQLNRLNIYFFVSRILI